MWLDTSKFTPLPQREVLQRVVDMIPRDAAVICPSPMLAHFSDHRAVISAYSLLVTKNKAPERLPDYDYIVLDGNWRNYEAIGQVALVQQLKKDPELQRRFPVVFQESNVYVLRKVR
jgi:hypothetical protein